MKSMNTDGKTKDHRLLNATSKWIQTYFHGKCNLANISFFNHHSHLIERQEYSRQVPKAIHSGTLELKNQKEVFFLCKTFFHELNSNEQSKVFLSFLKQFLLINMSPLFNCIFFWHSLVWNTYHVWWTGLFQATQAVKIQFKLEKKNPFHQTQNFKPENLKNQLQIDRGFAILLCGARIVVFVIKIDYKHSILYYPWPAFKPIFV